MIILNSTSLNQCGKKTIKRILNKAAKASLSAYNHFEYLINKSLFIETTLMVAAQQGHTDVVRALCKKAADTEATNEVGDTALMFAAYNGHTNVVTVLLEEGADTEATNEVGYTALMFAAGDGHTNVVTALCKKGADIKATNKVGNTALMIAALNGHTNVVTALLEEEADKDAKNKGGNTALMFAAQQGHTNVVTALCKKGADIKATNKVGNTALMFAAQQGHTNVVTALLEEGADTEATNKFGTALIIAALNGHLKVVKTLLEKDTKNSKDFKDKMGTAQQIISQLLEKIKEMNVSKETRLSCFYSLADKDSLIDKFKEFENLKFEVFCNMLTGQNKSGLNEIISSKLYKEIFNKFLSDCPEDKSYKKSLGTSLEKFMSRDRNEEKKEGIDNFTTRIYKMFEKKYYDIFLPSFSNCHAILFRLQKKDMPNQYTISIFNTGEGPTHLHKQQKGTNKIITKISKTFEAKPEQIESIIKGIINAENENLESIYQVFNEIKGESVKNDTFHRQQKGGNCSLKCRLEGIRDGMGEDESGKSNFIEFRHDLAEWFLKMNEKKKITLLPDIIKKLEIQRHNRSCKITISKLK